MEGSEMKHTTKSYVVLFLVVLIAVSCGPVTAVSTATKIILPTNTIAPTSTSLPEPSATATLSQVEEMFTIPTIVPDFVDTPTPIATPGMESSLMKLRNLSEEDYLNFIYKMNEYSYQNFPPFDDWWTEGYFIASQEAVAFGIQEYLYRFPESANTDRLRWQLAFINSVMYDGLGGNQYGDQWMIDELEKSLNRGEASPDQLESILGKYWFNVIYVKSMENLFGDGTVGWLYQVVPQVSAEDKTDNNHSVAEGSMFFVVRQHNKSQFETYLLASAWNLSFGTSYVFDVVDHNKNGIPEVALYIGGHGGTVCSGNLFIYEWNDHGFAELTRGDLLLRDCSENFEYSEIDSIPAITFDRIFPVRKEQYIWNGDYYEFSQYIDATPLEQWRNSVGESHFSYEEETKLLNEILASGEAADFRDSYADYLRYRLGAVYALQSKQNEAIRELENLRASPLDPTRTVFTDMARKFLELYEGDRTVYEACFQSRLIYDKAYDSFQDLTGSLADTKYEETFGIPFDPIAFGFSMCDEEDAFELMTKSIFLTVEDIPSELRKNGVDVDFSKKIDANLDGKAEEWLIIFDTYNQFLVFPNGSQYQAKRLDIWIGNESINYSSTEVSVESWNQFQNPVMIIQAEDEIALLEINENYDSKSLFYDFGIMDYVTAGQNTTPEFQLFFSKPSPDEHFPDHPYDGYRWSVSEKEFKNDLLEYSLFILHNPQKAIEIADQFLPRLEELKQIPDDSLWWMPYSYYIVGLCYELSGNQDRAAEIYWQLWHDFPDSHYARLAEFKLEPLRP
jgi:hypothetical protein